MNITDSISLTATNQYAYNFDEALQLSNFHLAKASRMPGQSTSATVCNSLTFNSGTHSAAAKRSQSPAIPRISGAWLNAALTPSVSTSLLALPRL